MKRVITTIIETVISALFPLSKAEQELLLLSREEALRILPKAPESPVPGTFAIFHYKDERVSKMIWSIKYKKSKKAIEIGGVAVYMKIVELSQKHFSVQQKKVHRIIILPTPITSRRRRERGYNQCELILDEIDRLEQQKKAEKTIDNKTTIPSSHEMIFEKNLLERIHHTSRQTLKNREDRLDSAKGVFGLNEKTAQKYLSPEFTKDSLVIIIDDVITTGSTMKEAMQTMKNAGFCNVIGVSISH